MAARNSGWPRLAGLLFCWTASLVLALAVLGGLLQRDWGGAILESCFGFSIALWVFHPADIAAHSRILQPMTANIAILGPIIAATGGTIGVARTRVANGVFNARCV